MADSGWPVLSAFGVEPKAPDERSGMANAKCEIRDRDARLRNRSSRRLSCGYGVNPPPSAQFAFNPAVCFLQAFFQWYGRFPAQHALQQRVVAIAAAHPLRLGKIVTFLQTLAGDIRNQINQLIDRDQA